MAQFGERAWLGARRPLVQIQLSRRRGPRHGIRSGPDQPAHTGNRRYSARIQAPGPEHPAAPRDVAQFGSRRCVRNAENGGSNPPVPT